MSKCPYCNTVLLSWYYLKCPHCNTYIYLKEMPNETRTLVTCSKCFKRVLYASNDYQLGGG